MHMHMHMHLLHMHMPPHMHACAFCGENMSRTRCGNMSRFLLLLMLQAFQQRADGLFQPLGTGLSARPRVGLLRAAPPPPPPPRGGLTPVMSGDDDPKDESHDRLMLLQSIRSQPQSTFAQKHAPFIQVAGMLFLAAILRDGMLNVGRGKRTRVWLGQKDADQPTVDLNFPQLPWIGAAVGAPCAAAVACAWLVTRSAMSCPKWAGRWFWARHGALLPPSATCPCATQL
jgi:hypothetical protein